MMVFGLSLFGFGRGGEDYCTFFFLEGGPFLLAPKITRDVHVTWSRPFSSTYFRKKNVK